MHLSNEDASLFFDLTWSWQLFVNQKTLKIPEALTAEDYQECSMEEKMVIRDLCYDSPDLLDEYLKVNPDNFSAEKLAIISLWKEPIRGKFYIERYLKNHAIFISEDDKTYAVLGLHSGFDEIIHKSHLPFLIEVTLLPFKGKVVYDGLVNTYNVHFGGGMKSSLKDVYMRAKQNDKIISSLEGKPKSIAKKTPHKDYTKEINALKKVTQTLRGGATQPPLNSPTFGLLKAAVELGEVSLEKELEVEKIYSAIRKLDRARNKLVTILGRMEG